MAPFPAPALTAQAFVRMIEIYLEGGGGVGQERSSLPEELLVCPVSDVESLDDPDHPGPVARHLLGAQLLHVVRQQVGPTFGGVVLGV